MVGGSIGRVDFARGRDGEVKLSTHESVDGAIIIVFEPVSRPGS